MNLSKIQRQKKFKRLPLKLRMGVCCVCRVDRQVHGTKANRRLLSGGQSSLAVLPCGTALSSLPNGLTNMIRLFSS